jgi:hypothetical protein
MQCSSCKHALPLLLLLLCQLGNCPQAVCQRLVAELL